MRKIIKKPRVSGGLDKYEREIEESLSHGKFKSVSNIKREIEHYQAVAKMTLAKKRNINIRVSEVDLLRMKAKAARKGIPYQTLVSSVIHQYSTDQIKE